MKSGLYPWKKNRNRTKWKIKNEKTGIDTKKEGEKIKMKIRSKRQKSAGPEKVQGRTGRESNLLLSQNIKISYNTWLSKLGSLNCLVIGGTGEGKSRGFVKPNIYSLPVDPRDGRPISFVFTVIMIGRMAACRQSWCWKSQKFYILFRRQPGGGSGEHRDLEAHPHGDTLPLTKARLLQ